MPGRAVKKNIDDIADVLQMKKKNAQSMVLFLGSRAGGLFRSQDLFDTMEQYSVRNFDLLSREGQFAESYKALKQDHFNDNDVHALLIRFLKPVALSESDIYLAQFIKQGMFDVIISTNIDSLLEKALENVDMRELYDFDVFIPEHTPMRADRMSACMVIKVFGDIYSRGYNVTRRDFYLDSLPDLKALLEQKLARDVLVIGFDPTWDAEVLRVFTDDKPESFLWLVTEEEALLRHTLMSRVVRLRQTRFIAGKIGGYEQFLKALYVYLYDKMPVYHQLMHEIAISLKSLHGEVQAIHKRISVIEEKLSRYLDNAGMK